MGDQMAFKLCLDNGEIDRLKILQPHNNIFDLNGYRRLSSVAILPKPVATTVFNWSTDAEEHLTPSDNDFLMSLA